MKDEYKNIIQNVLQDYALTCRIEPFNGEVIISKDMAKSYTKLRGDLVENGTVNLDAAG